MSKAIEEGYPKMKIEEDAAKNKHLLILEKNLSLGSTNI